MGRAREEKRRRKKIREEKRREEERRSEKRREEERRSEKIREEKESEERVRRKSQKKEDAGGRKGRKAGSHCVFPMVCGSEGSKSRLAKAAGAEPSGQMRGEKLHTVVAQSTFRSQTAQNTSCSEHFWKLRYGKSAHRCGTKHISKSKVLKADGPGPLLDVQMAGARDLHLVKSEQNVRVLWQFQKRWQARV